MAQTPAERKAYLAAYRKTDAAKAAKRKYREKMKSRLDNCDCGEPGVRKYLGDSVCQSCFEMHEVMYENGGMYRTGRKT